MHIFKPLAFSTIFLLFVSSLFAQENLQAEQLDNMIQGGMKDWQIPGLITVVVKEGEVVFKEVYGVKDLDTQAPVDAHTLFNMGSTTKAIICMALGILVDRGKLDWHDPVQKHLPSFQLSDPYIAHEARVQDLLTHNLGIQGADLLWFMDSVSTAETLARFAFAEKAYPIRGGYAYNNLMYAVAGELIQAVSGQHWTEFVVENIFTPLGMTKTKAKASELFEDGNYVTPYLLDLDDRIKSVNYNLSDQIGAAGMIWSCAEDISHYLQFLVNGGVYQSKTLLQPSTFQYLFKPHAFVPTQSFYPTRMLTHPNWTTYGLGWFQHDYRGQKLDFHTGSIGGLIAIAGVMHEQNVAVYVLANMDHAELRHAILYKAMDVYAFDDLEGRDWHAEVFELYDQGRQMAIESNRRQLANRHEDTRPSLGLIEYEGVYVHEMLGKIQVLAGENSLTLKVNDFLSLDMDHWHYDSFRSDKNNRYKSHVMVNFNLSPAAKVEELEVFGESFQKIK